MTCLRDLHNAIFNSFGFDGMEVASFTLDETWNQEDEIFFDTGDVVGAKTMSSYQLSDLLDAEKKIIYVYDFINMWTFLVELAAVEEQKQEIYILKLYFLMVKCLMRQWKKTLKRQC
jgi:hypothetical protein